MIVQYLNINRIAFDPAETNSPLIVDPNTVPSRSITSQNLQPVPRNRAQIGNCNRRIQLVEFAFGHCEDALQSPAELAQEHLFGFFVPKRPDHNSIILPHLV